VLEAERPDQAIVFVRTRVRCEQLFRLLRDRGLNVRALHGDMTQGARDGVMLAFKSGRLPVLVATDVAARGLDISTVTHIINYDVPTSPDTYVHRIGRTGRVGRSGRAITFVEPRQLREVEAIERHIGIAITPWEKGAVAEPVRVVAQPRRHSKPRVREVAEDETYAKLVLRGGRAGGITVADIVGAVTRAGGLDGAAVRDVTLLDRFAFFTVPERAAQQVVDALDGKPLHGNELRLQRVGSA
jgi:ATP-dependent RNA helicase DeaD